MDFDVTSGGRLAVQNVKFYFVARKCVHCLLFFSVFWYTFLFATDIYSCRRSTLFEAYGKQVFAVYFYG
jgi:hypothetical protein